MESPQRLRSLQGVATVLWLLTVGCSPQGSVATLRYESAPNASTEPQSPLRLTHLVLNARRDNAAKPIFAEGSEFKTERFTRPSRRTFSRLTQRIDPVLANNYTACLIRMKSPLAGRFTFVWKNAIEPDIAENPGISFTVVGDAQVHEYTLSMEGQDAVAWTGLVSDIGVVGPGNAFEVESITLADMLPHGPERITLGNVTMESVDPDSTVWTVTIPPSSQFETHVAMLDPHTEASDGAVFRVRVQENTGEAITLAEKSIGEAERGRWHRLRASLKPYEGKTINLLFDVDSRGSARSDYAVWGNPIIYSGATKARTPVILISCDTMRADHLSCYGYERSTSPNLDAFAGESVLFENAITPETWTLSAHTSMLTGLYPTHHRVSASTNLSEAVQTLPETLAGAGNLTAGFTGYRLWMSPSSGLAHGFDSYSTPPLVRDMVETKSLVNAWLDSHAGAPFFLFFHNYDLHSKFGTAQCADCDLPYYPPPNTPLHFARGVLEPETLRARCRPSPTDLLIAACGKADALSPQDIAHMIAMYDDSIRGVDAELGEFFGKLKAMDVYDDALIVVTADHGEHFGEHNQYVHEHVYECAARVPLLIKFPNGKYGGKRIRDMVQLVDLMPTILDVAGVAAPASDGQSLLPLVRGEGRAADWAYIRRQTIIAVRNNDWKYLRNIETGVAELYHLANDPRESVSVLDRNPAELPGLIRLAERFFLENEEGWHVAFMRPERDWRGAVVGTTGDAFQTVKLLLGGSLSYSGLLKWDEHTATANVGLLPREELLLRTRAESAPVVLQISASKQFLVVLGDAEPVKSRKFRVELDPASPLPKPVLPSQVVKPTFFIWHEATPPAGTRAPALTPEEIEALNALGYGRDIR